MKVVLQIWLVLLVVICGACRGEAERAIELNEVRTLAGESGEANDRALFGELFGVAVGDDDTVYVADGERGRIIAVDKTGAKRVVDIDLLVPSGLAIDKRSNKLIVAETGAHVIRHIDLKTGASEIIAGSLNQAGFVDGGRDAARFDAPVGVAVDDKGAIFVADSFNDAIRRIETNGEVKTVFGSPIKLAKTSEEEQLRNYLDTPCAVAVLPNGALVIADTGNNRVRFLSPSGELKTLQQRGAIIMPSSDAMPELAPSTDAEFQEPIGLAISRNGTIYIAEAGAHRIMQANFAMLMGGSSDKEIQRRQREHLQRVMPPNAAHISALSGASERYGFADGDLANASFARPQGLALTSQYEVVITDSDNKILRLITNKDKQRGRAWTAEEARNLRVTVDEFRARGAGRWNHPPFDRAREIAATFGEVRGAVTVTDDARFHNGIDIPGAYGETVYAMRDEVVLRPLAVEGANGARERLRLPQLGYIHLRIGRDKNDVAFDESKFQIIKDDKGKVARVRVRRGAKIMAGERIGTLNNQNHTHLIAGGYGDEMNGFAALELPGIKDTIAPIFERDAVRIYDEAWNEVKPDAQSKTVTLRGNARLTARVYDQMDGGAGRRKLGVYRLGFQVSRAGNPEHKIVTEPRWTLIFNRLPVAARANGFGAKTVFAIGSQAGYAPQTVFDYIVTNTLKDGVTTEDFLKVNDLENGAYVVRVVAEDFFGNRRSEDVNLRVEK